jgi:hypothetical protein
MLASAAWLIYIIAIVIIYLLLGFIKSLELTGPIKFLIAAIIAGLIIFILAPNASTSADHGTLGLLYIVAFLLPMILALWMIFVSKSFPGLDNENGVVIERTLEYDPDTGRRHLVDERRYTSPPQSPRSFIRQR